MYLSKIFHESFTGLQESLSKSDLDPFAPKDTLLSLVSLVSLVSLEIPKAS